MFWCGLDDDRIMSMRYAYWNRCRNGLFRFIMILSSRLIIHLEGLGKCSSFSYLTTEKILLLINYFIHHGLNQLLLLFK